MSERHLTELRILLALILAIGLVAVTAIWLTGHPYSYASLAVPGILIFVTAWRLSIANKFVTARMKAPDQVALARLEGVFDQQPDRALMMLDATGHILRMNEVMMDILATSDLVMPAARSHPEQLLGHRISDIMSDSALKTRLAWPKAFEVSRFDIAHKQMEASLRPLGYQPGLMLGWLLEINDVSQREILQSELHALLEAGLRGDFARRIDTDHGDDSLQGLGRQVNNLFARIHDAQSRLLLQIDAIGNGDLRLAQDQAEGRQAGPFQEMQDLTLNMAVHYTALVNDLITLQGQMAQGLHLVQRDIDNDPATDTDSQNRRLQLLSDLHMQAENLGRLLDLFQTGMVGEEGQTELLDGLKTLALVGR